MTDQDAEDAQDTELERLTSDTVAAFDGLPIQARLEFVANLLFDHGGARESHPRDWKIVTATEIIQEVIKVIRQSPQAANLRSPEP